METCTFINLCGRNENLGGGVAGGKQTGFFSLQAWGSALKKRRDSNFLDFLFLFYQEKRIKEKNKIIHKCVTGLENHSSYAVNTLKLIN